MIFSSLTIHPALKDTNIKTPKFTLEGTYTAKCVKVYDGDTAHFTFSPWEGAPCKKFCCRLAGYNSAEINGSSAAECAAAVVSRTALTDKILDKIVTLVVGDFDKYGRLLVTVYLDNLNVNLWMVENKYGCYYAGAGVKKWK